MDEKADVMGARKGMTEQQKMRYAINGMQIFSLDLTNCYSMLSSG